MYAMLKARARGLRGQLLDFVAELLRTPSYSLREERLAERVETEMRKLRFDEVFRDEPGNVVGVNFGRAQDRTLLLNSHMDTVAADAAGEWRYSPTSGRLQDGCLHGRGASDCKGGLAAQMYAAAMLKLSLLPMSGNVVVAATVAEENGRSVGVKGLMDATLPGMDLWPDWAVLGEPTGLRLYYGHDGWVELDVHVQGNDAGRVRTSARRIFEEISAEVPRESASEALRELEVEAPIFSTEAGPDRARVHVNRRLRSGENETHAVGSLQRSVLRALGAGAGNGLSVDVGVSEDPQRLYTGRVTTVRRLARAWSIDPFSTVMERSRHALNAAGLQAPPGKWRLNQLGMGTAGGVLTADYRVPTVGYGPGEESEAHAPNEKVPVDNLVDAVFGTAAIAQALVGIPVFGWSTDEV
jgi:acetylornithine deacetylase/succinyl-diaminopimelate desuccinylase-like protein